MTKSLLVGPNLGPNYLQRFSADDKLLLVSSDPGPNCLQRFSADDKSRS